MCRRREINRVKKSQTYKHRPEGTIFQEESAEWRNPPFVFSRKDGSNKDVTDVMKIKRTEQRNTAA